MWQGLLLLLLLVAVIRADLIATLTPAQILLNTTSNQALFTPVFSGSIRHACSYTNQTTGSANVILSTLDSSLYMITYETPGTPPLVRRIFDSAGVQILLGSFVFYEPEALIIALDMNAATVVIFDIASGFLDNLFVDGVDASSFIALDSNSSSIYISSTVQSTIIKFDVTSASDSLSRIALTLNTTFYVRRPIAIDIYARRAFVLIESAAIIIFDESWNILSVLDAPAGARGLVLLPASNILLLPDSDCGVIHSMNLDSYEVMLLPGIYSQQSPYAYVLSPYYIIRSPWSADDVIICDHVPLLLQNGGTSLRTLLGYGTSLGCKITDSTVYGSSVIVSCGKRLLKLVKDTDGDARFVAFSLSGIETPDAVISIDGSAQSLYAVTRQRALCASLSSAPPVYVLNRYSSATRTWTKIYSTTATILSMSANNATVCVTEYPRLIKCIDPVSAAIVSTATLDRLFISGIALLPDRICAISKSGNMAAVLNNSLSLISSVAVSSPEFVMADIDACIMVSAGTSALRYNENISLDELYAISTDSNTLGPVVRLDSAVLPAATADQPPWGFGSYVMTMLPTLPPLTTTLPSPPPTTIAATSSSSPQPTTSTSLNDTTTEPPSTTTEPPLVDPNVTYPFYEPATDRGWSDSPSYWWIVIPICFTAMTSCCVAFVLITGVIRRRNRAAKQPYFPFADERTRKNRGSFIWCCIPYSRKSEANTLELTESNEQINNNRRQKDAPVLVKEQPEEKAPANGYDPDHPIELQNVQL